MPGATLTLLLALVAQAATPSQSQAAPDGVARWIEALDDTADGQPFTVPAKDGRSEAIRELARLGADAVPALLPVLADRVKPRVVGAALALREIGPAAAAAVSPLSRRVDDPDPEVALAAALALTSIDPKGEAATRALALLLARISTLGRASVARPDDRATEVIVDAIACTGSEPHVALLQSQPDAHVRQLATARIADAGAMTRRPPLPPEPNVAEPSDAARTEIEKLVESLFETPEPGRRRERSPDEFDAKRGRVLAEISTWPTERRRELLLPLLGEPLSSRLFAAAELALDALPDDPAAADVLSFHLLRSKESSTARRALANHGGRHCKAAALEHAFARDPEAVDCDDAKLLLDLAPRHPAAIEALQRIAQVERHGDRRAAATALARQLDRDAPPATVALFGTWLARTDLPLLPRLEVLRLWANLPKAERAWSQALLDVVKPYLHRCGAGDEIETGVLAARILAVVDPDDPSAVRALLKVLRFSEDADGRDQAARAFPYLGDRARDALLSMIHDGSITELDRQWVAFAIGGMAGEIAEPIAAVAASTEPEVRRWGIDGIAHWNESAELPRDREAVRAVVEPLLADPQPSMRAAAAVALLNLDRKGESWRHALDALLDLVANAPEKDWLLFADHLADFGVRLEADARARDRVADPLIHEELGERLRYVLDFQARDGTLASSARLAATHALARCGEEADECVGRLVDADDLTTAINAVWALRFVRGDVTAARDRLVRALATPRPWVRANAACSLLELRKDTALARATLEELAASGDAKVASWCKDALQRYAPKKGDGK